MARPLTVPALVGWLLLAGCADDGPDAPAHFPGYDPDCATLDPAPLEATIDTGATMTVPLVGEESGLYIEYSEDPGVEEGVWYVTVSCDTVYSGYSCLWDVYATPQSGPVDYSSDLVDWEDYLGFYDRYTVAMYSDNAYDLDGFFLYTDPGVAVTFEVYLDGCAGQRYVYWVGDGAVHAGAPTNPIDLVPSAPLE